MLKWHKKMHRIISLWEPTQQAMLRLKSNRNLMALNKKINQILLLLIHLKTKRTRKGRRSFNRLASNCSSKWRTVATRTFASTDTVIRIRSASKNSRSLVTIKLSSSTLQVWLWNQRTQRVWCAPKARRSIRITLKRSKMLNSRRPMMMCTLIAAVSLTNNKLPQMILFFNAALISELLKSLMKEWAKLLLEAVKVKIK